MTTHWIGEVLRAGVRENLGYFVLTRGVSKSSGRHSAPDSGSTGFKTWL